MPSRRALLTTLGTVAAAGSAGCASRINDVLAADHPIDGSCDKPTGAWPTAGGDPGRTGRTDTAPPTSNADVVDLLAGVHDNGQQYLASSLPAVADGTAFIPVGGGLVAVALNAPADGPIWSHDLEDSINAVPVITCGVVLAPGLNQLVALDLDSGEQYWRADTGSHTRAAIASLDETTYVAGVNPVALDSRTGTIQWHAEGGDTLALDNHGVYTTRNVNGTGGIFAHDLNGEERWHLSLGKIVGSASVLDGTVWVADNRGTVYAIDARTGETYWSRSLTGVSKIHSGLAVRGEDVIIPAGTGTTSVALDATTGETRWTADTGIATGRPVVGDDWVAIGRTNTGITLYDRSTGEAQITWSRNEYNLGTIDGLVAVKEGFVIREGTNSGLSLLR